ncbi:PHB depolymerase family esterase [uncultured Cellulomonas sp.]|uniref:alpha/beta hydrolase family esterase n=1 Tax=uncultured Cellulomonas sp. TaxID=189682 RepID=UPI002619D7AA|nr:prolyl oligopeptidase family serine peptidase [uncultured Cellulomonas sp.]
MTARRSAGPVVVRAGVRAGDRDRTLVVVGSREAPPGRDLVLVLHGSRQDGAGLRRVTGAALDVLAARDGAVVAYLDGYRGAWNDARRRNRFPARRDGVDDVAFVRAVVDRLADTHGTDPDRVHAVGFSNGGLMALSLLHVDHPPLAGAAVVAMTMPAPDDFGLPVGPATRPVPVLLVHGTADRVVPYAGGRVPWWVRRVFHVDGLSASAPATAAYLARRNGITGPPVTGAVEPPPGPARRATGRGLRAEALTYARDGRPPVVLVTVHGGGHTVPGPRRGPRRLGRTATVPTADLVAPVLGIGTGGGGGAGD